MENKLYIKINRLSDVIDLLSTKKSIFMDYNGVPSELSPVTLYQATLGGIVEMVNKGQLYKELN